MNGGERKLHTVDLPVGPDVELLHLGNAAVHLFDGGAFSLIRRGAFSLLSSRKAFSRLSFLSCAVGDFRWPIFSDSPVFQLSPNLFSFSFLSSFYYFLLLPDHYPECYYSYFMIVLQYFCIFEDLQGSRESEKALWEEVCMKMAGAIQLPPALAAERAVRVSAVTKLVSRVITLEEVHMRGCFEVSGGDSAAVRYVVAGVRVVSDVVATVEVAAAERVPRWRFRAAGIALFQEGIVIGKHLEMGGAAKAMEVEAAPSHKTKHSWHFTVAGMALVLGLVTAITLRVGGGAMTSKAGGGTRNGEREGFHNMSSGHYCITEVDEKDA